MHTGQRHPGPLATGPSATQAPSRANRPTGRFNRRRTGALADYRTPASVRDDAGASYSAREKRKIGAGHSQLTLRTHTCSEREGGGRTCR